MKSLLTSLLLVTALLLPSCKDDPKPGKQQQVTSLLTSGTGQWAPVGTAAITVDGLDVTSDLFKDFTITFTADKLFTTGTTPVWLRQDTWRFKDNTATVMLRGQDDKEITLEAVSKTELKLSLTWDKTTYEGEGGRKKSIPGTVVFTLKK
jgi:hypothetical protein